jgi:hypothetical protein
MEGKKKTLTRVVQHICLKHFTNYSTPHFTYTTKKGGKTPQEMCNKTKSSQNIKGGTLRIHSP